MAAFKQAVLAAAVLAVALGVAHAESECWWTKAGICRLRSVNMMPELRAALDARIQRNSICFSHASEHGCQAGAPDNCKAFEIESLAGDEKQTVCADAGAQLESLEDYKTAVEASPAFQELCFTENGYVTWACMRDLALLSKFLGCTECSDNVLTLEKMHQSCTSAKDVDTCTGSASNAAKTFALNSMAVADLPKEEVPRPAAEKVIRALQAPGYYSPPPPPFNTIEQGLGPSPTPIGAASPIAFGLSVLGAVFVGVLMLAF